MVTPIYFVSLIARDNRPLFIQLFPSSSPDNLKHHFLSHMALDAFLSSFYDPTKGPALLFIQDTVAVYGFETNTGLRVVIGTSTQDNVAAPLVPVFQEIHQAYIRLMCNPFQDLATTKSLENNPGMLKAIGGLVDRWNTQ